TDSPKGLSVGAPDIRLGNNGQTVWAQFPVLKGEMPPERITLASDIGDFEFQTVVSETALPPPYTLPDAGAERSFGALLTTLVIAFVGGLILNVMPCVLPVLSIKLASAVSAVDRSHAEIRTGFLVSALGVMAFVWVLAAATLVAQAVGLSVGWGLQFQNPYFLTLMVAILALFAANTFGLFEITLPSGLMTRMDSESGKSGLVGDFASGAFAAMLATPCSAPFLGTAVAFALTGAPSDVVLIFSALGLGLALPYVLVAAFPSTLSALPKPGRWMLGVKWLLGLMLAATAAWLATVLAGVAGGLVAQISLALIGLAVLALWLGQRFAASPRITAASLVLLGALLAPALTPAPSAPVSTATALGWVPLDQGQIARSVAQGNVVFVDITADWCLTCKANKSLVLDRETVHTALSDEDVITMQGDWTRPDEAISAFLARHERFGIPFNAVYGPAAPEGIILSEVLTQAQVLDALAEAGSL
ncbi:MAG: thioredoxin family protein, partial [Pseudomonadota bacterium]